MASEKVKLPPPETFNLFLQLPLTDLMVPNVAKYLEWKDLFNFRCCSRYCKELSESAIAVRKRAHISNWSGSKVFFRVISQHCRRLRVISFWLLDWLTDELLTPLFKNNPLLEDVELCSCKSLTPKGLYPLAVNCKKLTSLHLNDIRYDEAFLEMLNQHGIQLKQVALSRARGFSEQDVCNFFRKQPRLEYIYLSSMGDMLLDTLGAIAQSCKDLETLDLMEYKASWSVKQFIIAMGVKGQFIYNVSDDSDDSDDSDE